jgi:hypothetical protein
VEDGFAYVEVGVLAKPIEANVTIEITTSKSIVLHRTSMML